MQKALCRFRGLPSPPTWYDFGGFPEALYQLQYPAPGSPALAQQVLDLLQAAGIEAQGDAQRPLDYRNRAPQAQRAHPSEDHFLPLFFALGAADDSPCADYLSREVMYGVLAMDAFALHAAP